MPDYPYRLNIFVPAGLRNTANQIAFQIDPDTGGQDTFSIPLSPSGAGDATYYGCSTAATEEMRALMMAQLATLENALYYRFPTVGDLILQATNSPTAQSQVGDSWGAIVIEAWNKSLDDAGLKRIEPPVWMPDF